MFELTVECNYCDINSMKLHVFTRVIVKDCLVFWEISIYYDKFMKYYSTLFLLGAVGLILKTPPTLGL